MSLLRSDMLPIDREAGMLPLSPRSYPASEPLPPEVAFLSAADVALDVAADAARRAEWIGVTAESVLLAEGVLTPDRYYRALARHLDLPFAEQPLRPATDAALEDIARTGFCQLAPNREGWSWLGAPRGMALRAFLAAATGPRAARPPLVLTSPDRLEALVRHDRRHSVLRAASHGLSDWDKTLSAKAGLTSSQGIILAASVVGLGCAVVLDPDLLGMVFDVGFGLLFLAAVILRLAATAASQAYRPIVAAERIPEHKLPIYTVIVPLFREARVVRNLVTALNKLDYPSVLLDIILVVEANDRQTLAAIERLQLPARYRTLIAPAGRPQTKPRALNVALQFARGDCVVIFDAEDEPEPQQLRDAAALFAARPEIACLQARLAIDNIEDSWLTRLFALEYAALFHVVNPGLAALGLPIALGGTSNHFRIDVLRQVNGWDAWNVTEDIDLGLRLARMKFRVASLPSTTFEEAPNTLKAWLAQRRRWQKGWMVTLGTHSRHLRRVWRELGPVNGSAAAAMLMGTIASSLLGPFFAAGLLLRLWSGDLLAPRTTMDLIWSVASGILVTLGLLSTVWPILLGLRRRGLMSLAGALALYPLYLLLLSIASWQAALEVCGRPYAWAKTEHGRAKKRLGTLLPG